MHESNASLASTTDNLGSLSFICVREKAEAVYRYRLYWVRSPFQPRLPVDVSRGDCVEFPGSVDRSSACSQTINGWSTTVLRAHGFGESGGIAWQGEDHRYCGRCVCEADAVDCLVVGGLVRAWRASQGCFDGQSPHRIIRIARPRYNVVHVLSVREDCSGLTSFYCRG